MWYEGLLQLSAWETVLATLLLTHLSIVSVTVYLHRYSSHRSLELHPIMQHIFRFWLWLATTINTKEFTALHRKHHAVTETPEDPHSPKYFGLKELLLNGIHHYSVEAKKQETLDKYGRGCPDDWIERNLYNRFPNLGAGLLLLTYLALFGVLGLTVWAIQMIWIPFLALGIINGVGHTYGYRNFECTDAATNVSPWGILIGGEELHNNHHAYPNSARLSRKWWEFDIGWMWIRIMSFFGLAKVRSKGPVVEHDAAKQEIDADTVWATLNDRYRIMAHYSRNVIRPYVKAEKARLGSDNSVLKRATHVLSRELSLLDDKYNSQIKRILDASPDLNTIYTKRLELLNVWQKRSEGISEMIEALTKWCKSAEETGIRALQEFSEYIRTHSIPRLEAARA